MERQFPRKEAWQATAETDFLFAERELVPILVEINEVELNNKGFVTLEQRHKYGYDAIVYVGYKQEVDCSIYENEDESPDDNHETSITLIWEEENNFSKSEFHEIEIEIKKGSKELVVRSGNPTEYVFRPLCIDVRRNLNYKHDLRLVLEKLLEIPDSTRLHSNTVKSLGLG